METIVDMIYISSLTVLLGLAVILLLFTFCAWRYTFFLRRGIPGPLPVPILGNVLQWRKGVHIAMDGYIKTYGDFCGYFKFFTPSILVSDPEVIKQILVKYFDRFRNRDVIPVDNPSISSALFVSRDEKWRKIRHTLTPAFSGRKMKLMSLMINQPADRLVENFKNITANDKKGVFECREVYGAFIMDTIALCAFGLSVDSQKNKDDPFVSNAKRFFRSIDFTSPAMIISTIVPGAGKIMRWFGISNYPEDVIEFFKDIIDKAIDLRIRGKAGKKVDFLQLIINAADDEDDVDDEDPNDFSTTSASPAVETKIKREPLNRLELMSQAMAFFVAGYETTSTAICFVSYLLATNPTHQDRLIDEIDRLAPTAEDVTYDNLKRLTFLDSVINETLRLYPPGTMVFRTCDETTSINGHVFPAGASVNFPIWTIHRDPKYWPDPEKFDPDRFNKENQAKRHKFAWLPFGGGPRNCLGLRFAMMEIRTALVRVLQEFRLEVAPETEVPPTLGKIGFLTPPNGIFLRAVARCK